MRIRVITAVEFNAPEEMAHLFREGRAKAVLVGIGTAMTDVLVDSGYHVSMDARITTLRLEEVE